MPWSEEEMAISLLPAARSPAAAAPPSRERRSPIASWLATGCRQHQHQNEVRDKRGWEFLPGGERSMPGARHPLVLWVGRLLSFL